MAICQNRIAFISGLGWTRMSFWRGSLRANFLPPPRRLRLTLKGSLATSVEITLTPL